jgi:undecaprenyl-phosphate 4-deoxy-4-formamido-L-arabinose transferase
MPKDNLTQTLKKAPEYSVIIPVYRAQAFLPELYNRLVKTMEIISFDFEIIFIEDCGGDGSWEIIEKLSRSDIRVKGIQLSRNYGQHNALLCGINSAQGEIIITLDDDLQHPPEEIPKILDKLSEGFDVVYGVPKEEQHGFLRDISSRITKMVLRSAMGVKTAQNVSAFRAFRAYLKKSFSGYHGAFVSIDVLLTWGSKNFGAITVKHDSRRAGKSNYTFFKLVTHAFNMMTGFSVLPLQLASLVGFIFTIMGMLVLVYVLAVYFVQGVKIPGFAFLASIIAIFSGAQLFALGVIGEYLARIHFRIMGKPAYVVRLCTGNCNDQHKEQGQE